MGLAERREPDLEAKMTRSRQISLALIAVAVIALVTAVLLTRPDSSSPGADAPQGSLENLVRPDSPRMTDGDQVQLVEFLDFECEACIALYPHVEDIKDRYGDRVEFVVRYMPLHVSSVNAALAAEAAGQQDAYDEMYDLLFQGAEQWGHQQTPERDQFFDYAAKLGLDMDQFTRDFDDPETLARVQQSEADGRAAGVTGTPTFFLEGERLDLQQLDDLEDAVSASLDD